MKKKLLAGDLIGILIILAVIITLLGFFGEGFLSSYNLENLSKTIAVTIIVGLSQLAVLSIGHLNLALGAMGCLTGMFTGFLLQSYQLPLVLLILLGLSAGALAGFIQGLFIVRTKINPFIVTLAFVSIFMGLVTGITKGEVFSMQPDVFKLINTTNVFFGIPLLLILSLAIAAVLSILFFKTVFGRQLLATGSNLKAADFAGINTLFIVVCAHTISGFLAGAAGILQISRMGSATPTIGTDWLLVSFAAPILGGTLLSGGKVSVLGTILGAALMSIIVNGLFLLDVSQYWFQTFIGGILLASYGIDKLRRVYLLQKQS
ncbi:MAG: ABC transporter permease [Desulfotignum sp.]|nr:ABC transporter permease [Desulfotignum sp.]